MPAPLQADFFPVLLYTLSSRLLLLEPCALTHCPAHCFWSCPRWCKTWITLQNTKSRDELRLLCNVRHANSVTPFSCCRVKKHLIQFQCLTSWFHDTWHFLQDTHVHDKHVIYVIPSLTEPQGAKGKGEERLCPEWNSVLRCKIETGP
jgi:hypothetical protein